MFEPHSTISRIFLKKKFRKWRNRSHKNLFIYWLQLILDDILSILKVNSQIYKDLISHEKSFSKCNVNGQNNDSDTIPP